MRYEMVVAHWLARSRRRRADYLNRHGDEPAGQDYQGRLPCFITKIELEIVL
jgi:hypothetical protein